MKSSTTDAVDVQVPQTYVDAAKKKAEAKHYKPKLEDGKPVEFGGVPRKTVAVCPACNSVSDASVQGPATHILIEKSGSSEPLFSEIDSL